MSKRVSKIQDPALILKAFKKFERPGSVRPGCIQIRDLLSALTNEGPRTKRLSKERANEVIRKVCVNYLFTHTHTPTHNARLHQILVWMIISIMKIT